MQAGAEARRSWKKGASRHETAQHRVSTGKPMHAVLAISTRPTTVTHNSSQARATLGADGSALTPAWCDRFQRTKTGPKPEGRASSGLASRHGKVRPKCMNPPTSSRLRVRGRFGSRGPCGWLVGRCCKLCLGELRFHCIHAALSPDPLPGWLTGTTTSAAIFPRCSRRRVPPAQKKAFFFFANSSRCWKSAFAVRQMQTAGAAATGTWRPHVALTDPALLSISCRSRPLALMHALIRQLAAR